MHLQIVFWVSNDFLGLIPLSYFGTMLKCPTILNNGFDFLSVLRFNLVFPRILLFLWISINGKELVHPILTPFILLHAWFI